jgi:hypothetical protein
VGVLYATFLAGLGGSSSSDKVRSITSDARLLPVLGALEASLEDRGGVRASDCGVGTASLLMAEIRERESVMSTKSSSLSSSS